jgi:hypothetical protein
VFQEIQILQTEHAVSLLITDIIMERLKEKMEVLDV